MFNIFFAFVTIVTLSVCENVEQTLYVYDEPASRTYEISRSDFVLQNSLFQTRRRRSSRFSWTESKKSINVSVNKFPDSTELRTTRTYNGTLVFVLRNTNNFKSYVYFSYDKGDTFENKTGYFEINGNYKTDISKLISHPIYKKHIIFIDRLHRTLFVTTDNGKNIEKIPLNFEPSEIKFHKFKPLTYIILDKIDPEKKLWLTEDFGLSWKHIQSGVENFFWGTVNDVQELPLYILKRTGDGSFLLSSTDLFTDPSNEKLIATKVSDVKVAEDYIFITTKEQDNTKLYLKYKDSELRQCILETDLKAFGYYIVDASRDKVLVAVNHAINLTNLYISQNLNSNSLSFSLSLKNVFARITDNSWRAPWISNSGHSIFVDVYKLKGFRGIYIATQLQCEIDRKEIDVKNLRSLITYSYGSSWQTLSAPTYDIYNEKTCNGISNCSLHLHQFTSRQLNSAVVPYLVSAESAPGIVMASGVIGSSLDGSISAFLSTDAGFTWKMISEGRYLYQQTNHGSLLIKAKYFKNGETTHIYFSTDYGDTWTPYRIYNKYLILYSIHAYSENEDIFFIFAEAVGEQQWTVIKLDFRNIFQHSCGEQDKYVFDLQTPCEAGWRHIIKRRKPNALCFVGENYTYSESTQICECNGNTYDCARDFTNPDNELNCTIDGSSTSNCTTAYQNKNTDRQPTIYVAIKQKLIKFNPVNHSMVVFPFSGLEKPIALDFDTRYGCLYWSDERPNLIARVCNGDTDPEVVLKSTEIKAGSLSVDWLSGALYFVDEVAPAIRVVSGNRLDESQLQGTVVRHHYLRLPRALVVHPLAGYLFWTDWDDDEPGIGRATLSGEGARTLIAKPHVAWPEDVAIDFQTDRIFWTDVRLHLIASSDLHGRDIKIIVQDNSILQHPFALDIFQENVYWNDWNRRVILSINKNGEGSIKTVLSDVEGNIYDLRVVNDKSQPGSNACSSSSHNCEYVCAALPSSGTSCICPDNLILVEGKCLCKMDVLPFVNLSCPACSEGQFRCLNGACLPLIWVCDGENDCRDKSDEMYCRKCTSDELKCRNGNCFHRNQKCDGINDCGDNSDEKYCDGRCSKEAFACENGDCIRSSRRCNGIKNCADGSDEIHCGKNCSSGRFLCTNLKCIKISQKCDGFDDCGDNSDEEKCKSSSECDPSKRCRADQFKCEDCACLDQHKICDGVIDCELGEEERDCPISPCYKGEFHCGDTNICINVRFLCDGEYDCLDGSDELNCLQYNASNCTESDPLCETSEL